MKTKSPPRRLLGRLRGGKPGPTLIALGALHGNEPAGVEAIRRVLGELRTGEIPLRGEFIGLAGNLAAFEAKERFVERDLNRIWLADEIRRLREALLGGTIGRDEKEMLDLLETFDAIFHTATGEVIFVDLHTSSADGRPFAFIGDTLRNRRLAFHLPIPVILGLEEQLDGGLTEYLCNRGCITVGIEAGRHDRPESVETCADAVWILLAASGQVASEDIPGERARRERLASAARGLPPVLEVRFRFGIEKRQAFEMRRGYMNFQTVKRGELLATYDGAPVKSPEKARILLPLYQALGNDGFFLAREFSPFWLALSRWLRRLGADRVVHWLPGVRRAKQKEGVLVVSPAVARWFVPQVFHLLGYRKERRGEKYWIVSRRRHDFDRPERIEVCRG